MLCNGTWPVGTSRWGEKRNIAEEVPVWAAGLCVQCGKCLMVCPPHAAIRAKTVEPDQLQAAPEEFLHAPARPPASRGQRKTRPLRLNSSLCPSATAVPSICTGSASNSRRHC